MDFAWSPEDLAFKEELEAFLDKEMPPFVEQWSENEDLDASRGVMGVMDKRKAWQNKLNEGRWAAILWPEEWGGRAATTAQQVVYTQVMAKYRVARASSTRTASCRSARRSSRGAPTTRRRAGCPASSTRASTGARASPSRRPAPTSRTCAPPRSSPTTARTTSSTARRRGSARRRSRSGASSSCAPTRPRSRAASSTKASRRSSSTWSCPASTSARSARSPATRCSARCSSPT